MILEHKVAIVTGASRGIGRSIALTLAEHGASVIANGTNEVLLKEVKERIERLGRDCIIFQGDVSDLQTSTDIAEYAIHHFGKIDILVNNAGINHRSATLDMKLHDWQNVLDVNLNGTLYFIRAVLPHMIQEKYGKIINVSSSTAKSAHKNAAPSYGASKAAVDYLTRHVALEMSKSNIMVNGVSPGPVQSDMTGQWTDTYREKVLKNIPLNRLGTPGNVADAVLFLASGMSDFITGETININGGSFMN